MERIKKARETMTAKERVRRTFAFEKTDRVTIGYETNPAIHRRLCRALGLPTEEMEPVLRTLGVDYRGVMPRFTGPNRYTPPAGCKADPLEGCNMRWVEHETGGYWDYCCFPLKDADDEAFARFPIPSADEFDYDSALSLARRHDGLGLYVGGPGMPDVINSNGRILGMEDVLCHLLTGTPAAMDFIRRRAALHLAILERTLDKCRGLIDFMWLGEDLGTQIAPMISLNLYRRALKPIHRQFVDLAKAWGIPAMFHTCGSSSWVYEDFIEMGVRGVDTLQPEARDMEPAYLKERFGGRLTLRGCISTAGPLATGTPQEVDAVCRDTLALLMPTGGYHFAPTHQIQDNTPVENVIAMYNAAHRYGVY